MTGTREPAPLQDVCFLSSADCSMHSSIMVVTGRVPLSVFMLLSHNNIHTIWLYWQVYIVNGLQG